MIKQAAGFIYRDHRLPASVAMLPVRTLAGDETSARRRNLRFDHPRIIDNLSDRHISGGMRCGIATIKAVVSNPVSQRGYASRERSAPWNFPRADRALDVDVNDPQECGYGEFFPPRDIATHAES